MSLPHIAIIDWRTAPQGDAESAIEKSVIGGAARLTRHLCDTDADLDDEAAAAQAIIIWHNMPLTAAGIARLKNCRAIIRNGVGFDSVDIAAARERGIAVCNVPDYGTEEVADHAIALAMALCRQILPLDAEAKTLGWNIRVTPKLRRLSTLTFGIIGLGRIGTATGLRAKALGFRVIFHDPYLPNGADKAVGIARVRTLRGQGHGLGQVLLDVAVRAERPHRPELARAAVATEVDVEHVEALGREVVREAPRRQVERVPVLPEPVDEQDGRARGLGAGEPLAHHRQRDPRRDGHLFAEGGHLVVVDRLFDEAPVEDHAAS